MFYCNSKINVGLRFFYDGTNPDIEIYNCKREILSSYKIDPFAYTNNN